jgi:hypothetical protein
MDAEGTDEATEPGTDGSASSGTKRRNGRSRWVLERLLEDARERAALLPQTKTELAYYKRRCGELEGLILRLRTTLAELERATKGLTR